jgi:hypothetical protein
MPVITRLQLRHDTAANWTAANPTLAAGEAGIETDTNKMKVGTGDGAWTTLPYLTGGGGGGGGGTGDMLAANNLSDLVNKTTSRINLGVAIGTDVEAHDADLTAIGGITRVKGDLIVGQTASWNRLGAGTDGQVLTADSAQVSGMGWQTFSATYTDEQVRDVIGTALVAGANVTITPNDAGDTITIASTGSGGGGGAVADGSYTDIVVTGTGTVWNIIAGAVGTNEIAAAAVTNPKLANMAANTVKGSVTGGAPADLSAAQVKTVLAITEADVAGLIADLGNKADKSTTVTMVAPLSGSGTLGAPLTLGISDFTTTTRGAVPNPTASTGRFLKDDGTWSQPPASVSGVGNVFPFTYNTSTLESITGSQLRGNNATFANSTKLWISETTTDGLDVAVGLGRIKAGFQVYIQDYTSASRYALFSVTSDSIDKGTYWEINVTSVSSLGVIPGGKVALQSLSSAQSSTLFSTTTTAPGLAPGSSAGGPTKFLCADGTWSAPAALTETVTGVKTFGVPGNDLKLAITGQSSGSVRLQAQAAASGTLVLPNGTDILIAANATQGLTNKTIALGSNTVSGTLAQFNTAITDADVPAALNGLTGVWIGTQAQYDAIGTKVSTVLYAIQP